MFFWMSDLVELPQGCCQPGWPVQVEVTHKHTHTHEPARGDGQATQPLITNFGVCHKTTTIILMIIPFRKSKQIKNLIIQERQRIQHNPVWQYGGYIRLALNMRQSMAMVRLLSPGPFSFYVTSNGRLFASENVVFRPWDTDESFYIIYRICVVNLHLVCSKFISIISSKLIYKHNLLLWLCDSSIIVLIKLQSYYRYSRLIMLL